MQLALAILFLLFSQTPQRPGAVVREFKAALEAPVKAASVSGAIVFPAGDKRVESVIVVLAWGMGASRVYPDVRWRATAERLNAALMVLDVQQPLAENIPISDQVVRNAEAGGGDGLIALLNRFAADSGRDELRTVPLLFWGFSASGSFGTTFAMLHPTRTIGFVRYNSHSRDLPLDLETLRTMPALLLAGGDDKVAGTQDGEKLWQQGRALEAPWTFGIQPGQDHGAGLEPATVFILSWIEGVIGQRVNGGRLREVDQAKTWRGDSRNFRIERGRASAADLPHTVWLPDEKAAKLWQQVVQGK
jgi:hypothetical protein